MGQVGAVGRTALYDLDDGPCSNRRACGFLYYGDVDCHIVGLGHCNGRLAIVAVLRHVLFGDAGGARVLGEEGPEVVLVVANGQQVGRLDRECARIGCRNRVGAA